MKFMKGAHLTAAILLFAGSAAADLVIENARVIDGTGAEAFTGATIVVSRDRIVSLDGSGASDDAYVIDAAGATVLPGLSELHVHSTVEFWTDLEGDDFYPDPEFAITSDADMAEFRAERVADRLLGFLDAGVTTIVDPGSFLPAAVEIRDQVNSGEILGPRMYVSGRLFTAPQGHPAVTVCNGNEWCIEHLTCNTNDAEVARQCAREIAASGVDGFKLVYDGGDWGPMHIEHMNKDVLFAIVDEGHKLGLPVIAHTSSVDDTADTIDAGVDALVHAVTDDGGELMTSDGRYLPELLNRFDVPMTTTVRFGDPENVPDEQRERAENAINKEIAPSLKAHDAAGVVILFGTDYEGIGTPADPRALIQSEIRVLRSSGFSEMDILVMMTGNSSSHPFTPADYGTVEPGQLADLLLVDGDPLSDLFLATNPKVVIKGGDIVIDKR